MEFLTTLRDANVTCASSIHPIVMGLLGLILWGIPLGFYIGSAVTEEHTTIRNVWYAIVALHVVVGLLVDVEALVTRGMFWPLQTLIISGAILITLTLPALLGYYLVQDPNASSVVLTACALATACIANAVMVSILFEYFHRSAIGKQQSVQEPRGRAPRGAIARSSSV